MKAWACNDYEAGCGYIVFADKRGEARYCAIGSPGFECSDWCDISVRRIPDLDGTASVAEEWE